MSTCTMFLNWAFMETLEDSDIWTVQQRKVYQDKWSSSMWVIKVHTCINAILGYCHISTSILRPSTVDSYWQQFHDQVQSPTKSYNFN